MKHLISVLVISASVATSAYVFAHEKDGSARHERLVEKLNLSDARSEEVKLVMKDFHDKRRKILQSTREQMKELHEQQKVVFESLLSDEEMAVLMEEFDRSDRFKRRHKRRHSTQVIEE